MMLTSVGRRPALPPVAAPMASSLPMISFTACSGSIALIMEADLIAHGVIAEDQAAPIALLFTRQGR